MKYRVRYHMHMVWDAYVDADSVDEALDKADNKAEASESKDYAFVDWERYDDDIEVIGDNEPVARRFDGYGDLDYLEPEAYSNGHWLFIENAFSAEDSPREAWDIVMNADTMETRYTVI